MCFQGIYIFPKKQIPAIIQRHFNLLEAIFNKIQIRYIIHLLSCCSDIPALLSHAMCFLLILLS